MKNLEKILNRALFISGMNGWSVILFSLLCSLVALVLGSWSGVVVGLAIAASGWVEIQGRSKLKERLSEAGKWLSGSQILFFCIIVFYTAYQLVMFTPSSIMEYVPPELEDIVIRDLCLNQQTIKNLVTKMFYTIYGCVILTSFFYQGGLFVYYKNAARAIVKPPGEFHGKTRYEQLG